MDVSFIKQMKNLEREVLLKSVELDDDGDDFQFELENFSADDEIIAIAADNEAVECNLSPKATLINSFAFDGYSNLETVIMKHYC